MILEALPFLDLGKCHWRTAHGPILSEMLNPFSVKLLKLEVFDVIPVMGKTKRFTLLSVRAQRGEVRCCAFKCASLWPEFIFSMVGIGKLAMGVNQKTRVRVSY